MYSSSKLSNLFFCLYSTRSPYPQLDPNKDYSEYSRLLLKGRDLMGATPEFKEALFIHLPCFSQFESTISLNWSKVSFKEKNNSDPVEQISKL